MQTIKMFGPSISDPTKIVNRDVPVCDELAYKAAGYQRGSIPEPAEVSTPDPVKPLSTGTEEVSLEDPESVVEPEPVAEVPAERPAIEQPAKPRKAKGQK